MKGQEHSVEIRPGARRWPPSPLQEHFRLYDSSPSAMAARRKAAGLHGRGQHPDNMPMIREDQSELTKVSRWSTTSLSLLTKSGAGADDRPPAWGALRVSGGGATVCSSSKYATSRGDHHRGGGPPQRRHVATSAWPVAAPTIAGGNVDFHTDPRGCAGATQVPVETPGYEATQLQSTYIVKERSQQRPRNGQAGGLYVLLGTEATSRRIDEPVAWPVGARGPEVRF